MEVKSEAEFYVRNKKTRLLRLQCKRCVCRRKLEYNLVNKSLLRIQKRTYFVKNKEKIRKRDRERRYIKDFGGLRQTILTRDNFSCRLCGLDNELHILKYGCQITVDHIDGNGCNKPIKEKNNHPTNLITLCLSCHGKKDSLMHHQNRNIILENNML